MFSHLEDEIYKTVAKLACTREEAVRDHEILAERTADIAHQLKTPLTSMSLIDRAFKSCPGGGRPGVSEPAGGPGQSV